MLTQALSSRIDTDRDRRRWHAAQARYWAAVAGSYDTYYADEWARLENSVVAERLHFLAALRKPLVVDLACGTGLGRDLVRSVNQGSRYVGVDISPQMLAAAPSHVAHVAAAMDQVPLRSSSADAVLVLFTSSSFAYELTSLLTEVARLLKPGAIGYISVLSRGALSRMLWPRNWDGHYRTRGDTGSLSAPVNRATVRQMRSLVAASGMEVLSVDALNLFSGVLEHRLVWAPGTLIGSLAPSLSHSLEVTVLKPAATADP